MHTGQRADPSLHRLYVSLNAFAPGQPDNRLRQRQRILRAMIDFPGQKILSFLRPLSFSNVDGDPADAYDAAGLVDGRGRRADAPANLTVGPDDSKLGFVGSGAFVKMGHRLV
ncbi:hypothetical protein GALL_555100 [mine drainage metagenome]|uniref:Uncharacterized protein n=1 Tax=mine drainage metagenome TaxID=410659 RepID=A0A1J5PCK7_9ZZZZ